MGALQDFAYVASEKYKEGKSVVEKAYVVKRTRAITLECTQSDPNVSSVSD
jgi:hypothetical protein